jgi:Outer membrane protein beta-barrel domain
MKKLVLSLCILVAAFSVKAQDDQKFHLAVGAGLSSLSWTGASKSYMGFGGEVEATLGLSETFQAFAQTGYNSYSVEGTTFSYVPLLVGAKYKAGNFKPGIGIGYGSYTASANGVSASESGFTFSPQVAYQITEKFEALAHYSSTSVTGGSYNQFGLKLFYTIF